MVQLDEGLGFFDEDEVSSIIEDEEVLSSVWDGETQEHAEVFTLDTEADWAPILAWVSPEEFLLKLAVTRFKSALPEVVPS